MIKFKNPYNKDTENISNNRHNRRRLATVDGTKYDLKQELPKLFKAFQEAKELYSKEVVSTPPSARVRGFEASLLNSKMLQTIQKHFPTNWMFGKYKRFILHLNGYIILFKKLDNKNRPMNVKTKTIDAISQQLSLPLFTSQTSLEEPILYFGYKKSKIGHISEPQLVYIDEDRVKWTVTNDDITIDESIKITRVNKEATPTLKKTKRLDKKAI